MKTLHFPVLITLLFVFNFNEIFSQSKGYDYGDSDFIRIEVESGMKCIRLLKEGLVCRRTPVEPSISEEEKWGIRFFNIVDVKHSKFKKLESYLSNCDFFTRDTIVDCPGVYVSDVPNLYITLIKGNEIRRICYIDGYCEEIKTCLELLNDLIPKEYGIYALPLYLKYQQ